MGEAGTHPTSTDHVSGSIQTASNGETVSKNQVNSLYIYIHKVMKKKIDIARSSAERDLTISTTKQIEALWNGQVRED